MDGNIVCNKNSNKFNQYGWWSDDQYQTVVFEKGAALSVFACILFSKTDEKEAQFFLDKKTGVTTVLVNIYDVICCKQMS